MKQQDNKRAVSEGGQETDRKQNKGFGGRGFMTAGLLLLFAALVLTVSNLYDERQAGRTAEAVLAALSAEEGEKRGNDMAGGDTEEIGDDGTAMKEELNLPDYVLNPSMPMPETVVDGYAYIGTLTIPKLDLELPVMSTWSNKQLKRSPCRYLGSAYTDDLIIAGHNYRKHFNGLKRLETGDLIRFSDEAGNLFQYEISQIERLGSYDVAEMEAGDWDLTLFTCTAGGSVRLTLRCRRLLPD